jgi:hypothetical protein
VFGTLGIELMISARNLRTRCESTMISALSEPTQRNYLKPVLAQNTIGGKCRRGNVFCRAAGERRPDKRAGRESGKNQSGFSRRDFRRRLKDKKAPDEPGPEAEQDDAAFLTVLASFPVALTVAGLAFFTAAFFGVTTLGFLGAKTFSGEPTPEH